MNTKQQIKRYRNEARKHLICKRITRQEYSEFLRGHIVFEGGGMYRWFPVTGTGWKFVRQLTPH